MKNLLIIAIVAFVGIGVSMTSYGQCCGVKTKKTSSVIKVCTGCGEIKGSAKCCDKSVAKCSKCGLHKGSIGCCKGLKPAKGDKFIKICKKCGEQKGTEKCCKKDAKSCKGGMIKGSPGYCKIPKKK